MFKNLNIIKKLYFEYYKNHFCIQMYLQLISIPGCDNKSLTISVWPFSEAKCKGVKSNI